MKEIIIIQHSFKQKNKKIVLMFSQMFQGYRYEAYIQLFKNTSTTSLKDIFDQVRIALQKQREMKMAKLQAAEPPKPKEITVIAGEF